MTAEDDDREALASQKRMAELALAVLTMRVNTPAGRWLEETFGDEYAALWREARAIDGDEAEDSMFLWVLNMAWHLVEYLTQAAPQSTAEDWLGAIHADHIEGIGEE